MYDSLTPLFDQVTTADLTKYFKSEGLGVGPDEADDDGRPRARRRDDHPRQVQCAARRRRDARGGDLGSRLDLRRGPSPARRAGALQRPRRRDRRPGPRALDLISSLQNFQPSEQTEAEVAKQTEVLESKGKEGRAVLRDIDTFISGINDHIKVMDLPDEPWTRNDVFAVNALKGQFVGQEAATRRGARSSSQASPTPSAPSAA